MTQKPPVIDGLTPAKQKLQRLLLNQQIQLTKPFVTDNANKIKFKTMVALNPYLNFPGTSEEAFNFYQSTIGGEIALIMRFRDIPEDNTPENEKDKICHISLKLPNGTILMATDALESQGHKLTTGNSFFLSLGVESVAEADRVFAAFSAAGQVQMPMDHMFWGDYFGIVTDKFGTQWMISYTSAQQQ
uniref:VOC family protein n=1 Tax=Pedobacter schmidteae TaxID=2201271 RepID=UPI001D02DC6C|nr:VOC family protein [Pedobacter schmidteae]